jgi:hypothetical protein
MKSQKQEYEQFHSKIRGMKYTLEMLLSALIEIEFKNFHSRTVHLDIIKVLLPTDAQENCFKKKDTMLPVTKHVV